MNYLAHFSLAAGDDALLVGAVLGDFVRGRSLEAYPAGVQTGIRLHRAVDAYSDAHPAAGVSRGRIAGPNRRYAGPIVDIIYDHLLARDWSAYHPAPLATFVESAFAALHRHPQLLPPDAAGLIARMEADGWLVQLRERTGLAHALRRVGRRVRHPNTIEGAIDDFDRDPDGFAADFAACWPDVTAHCTAWIAQHTPLTP